MYTAARRCADPPRVRRAAPPTTAARATPPPAAEHTGEFTPLPAVSRCTAARDDALGATLARAVAERAQGGSGMGHPPGATLQRFLGIGKKKKPPRPTQALPAPARPKQDLPAPARPKQALPPSAAASPSVFIPGAVPQALIDLGARRFDLGSEMDPFEARQFDMDPFEARQFNLDTEAPAVAPPPPAAQPEAAAVAPSDDAYAPDLVPDESGLIPVAGNPYLESARVQLCLGPRSDDTPVLRGPAQPPGHRRSRRLSQTATDRPAIPGCHEHCV